MSKSQERYPVIPESIYREKVRKNESYTGFVEYNNQAYTFVFSEVVIETKPATLPVDRYTKYTMQPGIKYNESPVKALPDDVVHIYDKKRQQDIQNKE